MGFLQRMQQWSQAHQPKWLVILRAALGLLLLFKGISFISHANGLTNIISNSEFKEGAVFLTSYITLAHLLGGAFIILGLLTRWMVAIQIPILIGAVFFINASNIFAVQSEFALSVVVLLLLLFFFFEGGGPYSMDRYIKTHLL